MGARAAGGVGPVLVVVAGRWPDRLPMGVPLMIGTPIADVSAGQAGIMCSMARPTNILDNVFIHSGAWGGVTEQGNEYGKVSAAVIHLRV